MKNKLFQKFLSFILFSGILLTSKLSYADKNFYVPQIKTVAKQAVVIDYNTGEVLFSKNAYEKMYPASMSKLMTAYLIFERLKDGRLSLDDEFTVSERAWRLGGAASGGSTMFLPVKSKVKIQDLLRGIIVQSGNDACIVAAENISGSEENFAKEMTLKAKELGLENSSFANSTGLTNEKHYMTAYDLAKLARIIVREFPEYFSIYSEKEFKYNGIKQGNRNPLLYTMPEADGMKTGHTSASGYGLVGTAKKDGRRLISVVNGLERQRQRGEESEKLLNWGFREFDNFKFFGKGEKVGEALTWFGKKDFVDVVSKEDIVLTIPRMVRNKVKVSMIYDEPVSAPIRKGDKIAKLKITLSNDDIREFPLYASEDVKRLGFFGRIFSYIEYKIFGLPIKE